MFVQIEVPEYWIGQMFNGNEQLAERYADEIVSRYFHPTYMDRDWLANALYGLSLADDQQALDVAELVVQEFGFGVDMDELKKFIQEEHPMVSEDIISWCYEAEEEVTKGGNKWTK